MNRFLLSAFFLLPFTLAAQPVSQKLQKAFQQFENDSQLKHAISSLYVIDAATGQVVFDKNAQVGLAGASTQKIITAATAFEFLGKGYRYKTELGYDGEIKKGVLDGSLYLIGSGDPTLGSWRWSNTKENIVLSNIISAIKDLKIKSSYGIDIDNLGWNSENIPDGWIWQDIGNYYGAGATKLNWRENQVEVILKSGRHIGDKVEIIGYNPDYPFGFQSELVSAAKGTGDNAYIYYQLNSGGGVIRGTIPIEENHFIISGSLPDPLNLLLESIKDSLRKNKFEIQPLSFVIHENDKIKYDRSKLHIFFTIQSPSLDSIIYWFLKKSINLYGEALIKTFAYEKQGFGSTDSGVAIVRRFWKDKGLDDDELNIYDGSGLSPLNRVTTHAQVEILKYAKTKNWFQYFYNSLPDYNGMKMKSGTISDVKGFCGYHKAKDGKEYIFSFLVNNYNGKTTGVVNKMYKVLDELK